MSTLIKDIDAIHTDMVMMESMLTALAAGAYNGTRPECIGNSLEILKEYLVSRSERLEDIAMRFRVAGEKEGRDGEAVYDNGGSRG